jgi:carbon storage regulator
MLVLTRRPNEKIHIGDDIIIIVTKISGDQVKIGIDAPRSMEIVRGELKAAWRGEVGKKKTE